MKKTVRIGVDIGGTFTDFVLHDPVRHITRTGKRLTTPEAPSRAIVEGVLRLMAETSTQTGQIAQIVHGTTLITNTVLERTGARVGLLATRGFRDVVEMGRESRFDTNDLFLPPIPVLVPRERRLEVAGRLMADGSEREALDEHGVAQAARRLVEEEKVEALAIAFMHVYRNRAHEQRAREIVARLYPDLLVSLSCEVAPEIREYERSVTTVVNAYVQPRVHGYLDRLRDDLAAIGFGGELHIMLSSGGVTTLQDAKDFPVRMIESGPAAGAMAAAFFARQRGEEHLLGFDVGGTTAKMFVVEGGQPLVKHEFEAGRLQKFKAGSGLPLKVSVVDMIEVGSGGGSIAAVAADGLMKVGPRSASSVPGPVCYDRGGTDPTVTDADLLLGALNPANFLGGEMALALDKVREAMRVKIASPLGLGEVQAARGIQDIVNESMASATRMHLAERGKDPRDHALFAFGGAGPVHAYALARLLGLRRLIVPLGAGVISAFGLLVAPPSVDKVRGYVTPLDRADLVHVNALFEEMALEAREVLAGGRTDLPGLQIAWSADMRYAGQGFEITVPLQPCKLDVAQLAGIREAFSTAYRRQFDRIVRGVGIEVVNWRLTASLPAQDIHIGSAVTDGGSATRGTRLVHVHGHGEVSATVYDRYRLPKGLVLRGPAVIEERETSCAFGPDCTFHVDGHANLVVDIDPAPAKGAALLATQTLA